uniref:Uncharacterized protein n=1 Tax=Cannabis sativa TaxID=3483 RepID=A0A803QNX8_CANSA
MNETKTRLRSQREYPSPKGIGDKAVLKMLNIVLAFHPGQLAVLRSWEREVLNMGSHQVGTPILLSNEASVSYFAITA